MNNFNHTSNSFNQTSTSPPKFLIHPTYKKAESQVNNIFKLQSYNQQPKQWHNQRNYSICGDLQFKQKFLKQRCQTLDLSNLKKNKDNPSMMYSTMQAKFNMTSTIDRDTMMSKLRLDQQLKHSRDQRSFRNFKQARNKWDSIQARLQKITKKQSTVMKDSVKSMYAENNPEKMDLINDNIPQFWKHSLRINNKKLKSHINNHQFTQQRAQEMMQTLRGTKKLQKSIPKLPSHLLNLKKQKIVLGGKSKRLNRTMVRLQMSSFNDSILDSPSKTLQLNSSQISKNNEQFQEVFKINYSCQNRWMGLQKIF